MAPRHPAVEAALKHLPLDPTHLREDLREVAVRAAELGHWMADNLPQDPQLTLGLHDLIRAKDCFVRAALSSPAE